MLPEVRSWVAYGPRVDLLMHAWIGSTSFTRTCAVTHASLTGNAVQDWAVYDERRKGSSMCFQPDEQGSGRLQAPPGEQ